MNLLCPSCQKMLTVPDHLAGQLMKCPLCSNNFTVPGLPGAPTGAAAAPAGAAGSAGGDLYGLQHEPALAPSSPPVPQPTGGTDLHTPSLAPPPPLTHPPAPTPEPAPSIAPALPPTGYQTTRTMFLSPRVLPWVAPVCLVLIFFLQLPNWVGIYPGGVPWVTGNAWQTAFNLYTHDHDLDRFMHEFVESSKEGDKVKDYSPGVSALLIFYLLVLFFPTLAVTIASVALPFIPVKLPPAAERILPWRWGIVAAANLVLFLFLGLQLLVGFSVESKFSDDVNKQIEKLKAQKTEEIKQADAQRGVYLGYLSTTFWLKLVVLLHLVAILCSLLAFWVTQRGSQRPAPKIELAW